MTAIEALGTVKFSGDVRDAKNVSAIGVAGEFLVIGADETNRVQILARQGDHYKVAGEVVLKPGAKEIDIEGIACEGDAVYVIGSHSRARGKVDPDGRYEDNLAALTRVTHAADRDLLCRFRLDETGRASAVETTSLRDAIDANAILNVFARTPSKENGVDIEGVEVRDGELFVGFRGPVLRGGFAVAMTCRFAQPVTEARLLFVNMGGRGFRDLARVGDGFLALAGPVGDGPGAYQVYWWDGGDGLPGGRTAGRAGRVTLLGDLPVTGDVKAEGIVVLKETAAFYEVLIVFDGAKDGGATRFRVAKP